MTIQWKWKGQNNNSHMSYISHSCKQKCPYHQFHSQHWKNSSVSFIRKGIGKIKNRSCVVLPVLDQEICYCPRDFLVQYRDKFTAWFKAQKLYLDRRDFRHNSWVTQLMIKQYLFLYISCILNTQACMHI